MRKAALILVLTLLGTFAYGADIRQIYKDVISEKEQVDRAIDSKLNELRSDRKKLTSEVRSLEADYKEIISKIKRERSERESLQKQLDLSRARSLEVNKDINTIESAVRGAQEELISSVSGLPAPLKPEIEPVGTDLLDSLKLTAEKYLSFIRMASEVRMVELPVQMPDGSEQNMDVLAIGSFGYLYSLDGESGYLEKDSRGNLVIVNGVPYSVRKSVEGYIKGDSESVGLDLTGGTVYSQWENRITPSSQVRKGGLLVIPIFVVAVFGLLLIAERIYHLYIRSSREIAGVSRIISMVGNASEEDIEKEIESMGGKPVGRVLGAVFSARNTDRNVRADILEQSLINESTLLERNLSLLTAVAAIAPMLGLIGTVTGMISTFHAITIFGSGDPRMMAGRHIGSADNYYARPDCGSSGYAR